MIPKIKRWYSATILVSILLKALQVYCYILHKNLISNTYVLLGINIEETFQYLHSCSQSSEMKIFVVINKDLCFKKKAGIDIQRLDYISKKHHINSMASINMDMCN